MEFDKKKVYIIIFLVAILVILILTNHTKNCNYDQACFDSYAQKCSKVIGNLEHSGNVEQYTILGSKKDNCVFTVQILKLNEQASAETKKLLDGKAMICEVPTVELQKSQIQKVQNLNDYCTGQLKEAYLQMAVDKLYEVVTKTIGAEEMAKSTVQNPV